MRKTLFAVRSILSSSVLQILKFSLFLRHNLDDTVGAAEAVAGSFGGGFQHADAFDVFDVNGAGGGCQPTDDLLAVDDEKRFCVEGDGVDTANEHPGIFTRAIDEDAGEFPQVIHQGNGGFGVFEVLLPVVAGCSAFLRRVTGHCDEKQACEKKTCVFHG